MQLITKFYPPTNLPQQKIAGAPVANEANEGCQRGWYCTNAKLELTGKLQNQAR